jgi:hypothetical protein
MSKRYLEDADPFAAAPESDSLSVHTIDSDLFGKIEAVDSEKHVARPLDIFSIFPDPTQPRRAIPSVLRAVWAVEENTTAELFDSWHRLVEEERGGTFDLDKFLKSSGNVRRLDNPGPLESTFLVLVELAASIRRDKLTNPITVAQDDAVYYIETGERRWLAYHLLYTHFEDEKWARIPSRLVNVVDIWRQASENNARADLNAISRARQLAVLLMDMLDGQGYQFNPFRQFEDERDFYAQVESGYRHRIPRGKSEQLLSATGFKSDSQLRQYRRLLSLPTIVWNIADDLNWSEKFIRDLLEQADDEESLIALAATEAGRGGYNVTSVTVSSVTEESQPPQIEELDVPPAPGSKQHYARMARLLAKTGWGKQQQNEQALAFIHEHKIWLDAQEKRLLQYLEANEEH